MRTLKAQEIMARIAAAETDSPIAVYRNTDGTHDCRFAGPLQTHLDILRAPDNLVGVYTRHDDQNAILAAMGYIKPLTGRKRGPRPTRNIPAYEILDEPPRVAL